MRAVVVTSGWVGDGSCQQSRYPAPLLWLGDRPFVQHLCEGLFRHQVKTVDWVHDHPIDDVRQFLGRGQRWGMSFRHHVARSEFGCYDLSRAVVSSGGNGDPVLFGHADRLVPARRLADRGEAEVILYGTPEVGTADWTWGGWAELSASACRQFPHRATDEAALVELLAGHALGECRWELVEQIHGARTLLDYLASNRHALAQTPPNRRVSRAARIHPTAKLIGAVHVGRNVEIGAGAVVGPNVTVGTNCFIDRGAHLAESVVLPDTFVASHARLARVVADRNRIYALNESGETVVATRGPVGCLARTPMNQVASRLTARAKRLVRTGLSRLRATPPNTTPARGTARGRIDQRSPQWGVALEPRPPQWRP